MSAAASSTSVALRPWPAPKKEKLEPVDVFEQVGQLAAERGHLRYITEQTLQDEVDAGDTIKEDVMEGIEEGAKKDTPSKEDRLKELQDARHRMWTSVEWARFYAGSTLDLVALILSQDSKKNLDSSFSTLFKQQRVPRGSFGMTAVVEADKKDHEIQRDSYDSHRRKLAARGSRMQALEWATDNILKAATQLETEVRKEVKYWDEILSISEKGWSLQRFRKDQRHSPFAVRYGFREASDHFKARGLAPLHMDKEGGIILDPALALQPKTLRVRISDDGQVTGTSSLPVDGDGTDLAVEKSIQLARDSLFEEELYHEISMETRQLLAYGVELRNSVVHLTAPGPSHTAGHRTILIDCIPRDENVASGQAHSQDWLAQNIAEALRLLLAHEHRMRLHRRSEIPPPLTQHKRQYPPPPLLRTLLAMFSHLNAVESLKDYLDLVIKTLDSASINVALQISREIEWQKLRDVLMKSPTKDFSAIDQLLEFFMKPFRGLAALSLPSSNGTEVESVTIAIRTYMGSPTFGTEYKVTLPPSLGAVLNLSQEQRHEFIFSSIEEVKSYIEWILSLDLTHTLLLKEYAKKAMIRSKEPQVTISVKDGKKIIKKDVAVNFAQQQLTVSVAPAPLIGNSASAQTFTWTGTPGADSFREKIKCFINDA